MMEKQLRPQLRFPEFDGVWHSVKLSNISNKVGYGIGSSAVQFDGVNQYLRITDIDESSNQFSPKPLTSPEGKIDEKYYLKKGDIVFARTGASVGKSYIYDEKDGVIVFAGFLIKFSIIKAVPKFVFYSTLTSKYWQWVQVMSMRSGQPGLNVEELKSFKINIPSLPEQQKIASFLSSVDKKIDQLQQKKSLLEQYKKGVMQQVFSQQLRFKDDNGEDYSDWKENTLKNICEIIGGGTPDTNNDEYWNGEIQWFTPTEIKQDIVTKSIRTISKKGLQKSSAKILPVGTILMTTRATIGEVAIAMEECTTNQGFQSLIVNEDIDNIFIFNWIKMNKHQLMKRANGSTFSEISKSEIEKIKITIPCKEEQTKIANFLSGIDKKIELVNTQRENTQAFKKGLLQQLFV